MGHAITVLPAFLLAGAVLAGAGLTALLIRRRLERALGATLIGLGIDLAAAAR